LFTYNWVNGSKEKFFDIQEVKKPPLPEEGQRRLLILKEGRT
jgi:hypothetical protein